MSRFNNLRKPLVVVLTTALLTTAVGSPAFAQTDPSPSESVTTGAAVPNAEFGFETQDSDGGVVLTGLGSVEVTDGQLHIPAVIDGKKVVGIAEGAFKDAGLKGLVFDEGVSLASIGNGAFQGLDGLHCPG